MISPIVDTFTRHRTLMYQRQMHVTSYINLNRWINIMWVFCAQFSWSLARLLTNNNQPLSQLCEIPKHNGCITTRRTSFLCNSLIPYVTGIFCNEQQWLEAKYHARIMNHIYLYEWIIVVLKGVCHKIYAHFHTRVVVMNKAGFANAYWRCCKSLDGESMSDLFVLLI